MNALTQFHDDSVLRVIQEWLYAYSPLSAIPFAFLLLGMPTHRRLGALVTVVTAIAAVACLVLYDAVGEVPVLAWTLITGLALRGTQLIAWILPAGAPPPGDDVGRIGRRLRPRAGWFSRIVRDYLRADPRGVYWFDLARARHGLPVRRTPSDRCAALIASPDLTAFRIRLWHGPLARVAEWRIATLRRLPRYWHIPNTVLELGQPAIRAVLELELERTERLMRRSQAAENFGKFRERSPESHAYEVELAGRYGQTHCRLREALAEYLSFREPWREEEPGLLDAAMVCYATWQTRAQSDTLWHLNAMKHAEDEAVRLSEKVPSSSVETIVDVPEGEIDSVSDNVPAVEAGPETDEALFNLVAKDSDPEPLVETLDDLPPARSFRDEDRLRDLQTGCALLEAYLGAPSTENFREDVDRWERLLDRPSFRLPGMMLLMMQCLRTDQSGKNVDRIKLEIRSRLRSRFRGAPASDVRGRKERQLFQSMYVDLLFDRGEYASVRSLFSDREDLTSYHWKLLADATTALAMQLTGQEELRDMLQYEAISYYFRSGQAGLWTLRTAGPLLGVETTRELIDQFDRHPVKVSRPLALSLGRGGTAVGKIVNDEEEENPTPPPRRDVRPAQPVAKSVPRPAEPEIIVAPPVAPPVRPVPPKPPVPKATPPATKPIPPVVPPAPVAPPIAKPAVSVPPVPKPVPPVAKPASPKAATRPAPPPPKPQQAAKAPISAPPVVQVAITISGGARILNNIASFPHTIGRAAPSHLVIADPKLAGVHFMLTWENGSLTVRDPNGHGVSVNGKATKLIALSVGDRVQAGGTVMEVMFI